ncbi:hypothetical protein [Caldiplasma sukawensis]
MENQWINEVKKYIDDLRSIWKEAFRISVLSLANPSDIYTMAGEQFQVSCNINIKLDSENITILRENGIDVITQGGKNFIKPMKDDYGTTPVEIKPSNLKIKDCFPLLFNLYFHSSKFKDPVDIVESFYHIKNELKLPDEMFYSYPSRAIENPGIVTIPYLQQEGRIMGSKIFYSFFYRGNDRIMPALYYPARITLTEELDYENLKNKVNEKFNEFMETKTYERYEEYRVLKNVRNKMVIKKWAPISLSTITEKELSMIQSREYFVIKDGKVWLSGEEKRENLYDEIEKLRLSSLSSVEYWFNLPFY